jgi:hypothetical protein
MSQAGRVKGKTVMATAPWQSALYLSIDGPPPGHMWIPLSLVFVSNDDHTVPGGVGFAVVSIGQGDPPIIGSSTNDRGHEFAIVSIPGNVNFARLNAGMRIKPRQRVWARIGGNPAVGTPFTMILHVEEIIGLEEVEYLV